MDNKIDEDLLGNEKIEEAIAGLQQSPTEELLAHAQTHAGKWSGDHCRRTKRGSRPDEAPGSENFRRKQLVGSIYQL